MVFGSIPLVAKIRPTASPILLLGVLAPAVTPILTGPVLGIQSADAVSSLPPRGRWRIAPEAGSISSASSPWEGGAGSGHRDPRDKTVPGLDSALTTITAKGSSHNSN